MRCEGHVHRRSSTTDRPETGGTWNVCGFAVTPASFGRSGWAPLLPPGSPGPTSSSGCLGHLPRADPLQRLIFTAAERRGPCGGGFRPGGHVPHAHPVSCSSWVPRPHLSTGDAEGGRWLCDSGGGGGAVVLSTQHEGLTRPREGIFKVTVCTVMLFHPLIELRPNCRGILVSHPCRPPSLHSVRQRTWPCRVHQLALCLLPRRRSRLPRFRWVGPAFLVFPARSALTLGLYSLHGVRRLCRDHAVHLTSSLSPSGDWHARSQFTYEHPTSFPIVVMDFAATYVMSP